MSTLSHPSSGRRATLAVTSVVAVAAVFITAVLMTFGSSRSAAAATSVDLGTADGFAVLAGQTVTNTGPSVLWGDLGVSPGLAATGFPPGTVLGTLHAGDAVADQAQNDLTTADDALAAQPSDQLVTADLAGLTLTTGVYTATTSLGLSGELTLDAQGDPSAVFVLRAGSTLTTASASAVVLTNGAQACNVFWQVGSSATLGTASTFRGTVLALASISAATGATVEGRLLARTGSVTLDDNVITQPACAPPTFGGTTSGGTTSGGTSTGGTGSGTGSTTGPGGPGGTGSTTGPGGPGGTGSTTGPGGPGGPDSPTPASNLAVEQPKDQAPATEQDTPTTRALPKTGA